MEELPAKNGDRYDEALQMVHGGYSVVDCDDPDVVLVGNGSDVLLLVKAAEQLKAEGVRSRVVTDAKISGLDHFGYSAPAKVLEEKFGYTVEHTLAEIKEFLATR